MQFITIPRDQEDITDIYRSSECVGVCVCVLKV